MIRSPTHIFHETKTPTGLDQKFRRAKMFEHLWYRGLNQPCFYLPYYLYQKVIHNVLAVGPFQFLY